MLVSRYQPSTSTRLCLIVCEGQQVTREPGHGKGLRVRLALQKRVELGLALGAEDRAGGVDQQTTRALFCDVVNPDTGTPYDRDPRSIAKAAC